jgi:hypothetical protein
MPIQIYGVTLLAVSWTECVIALFLLFARIYTTWKITRHVRLDLYLILLTFVWNPLAVLKRCCLLTVN